MASAFKLGFNGKFYRNTGTYAIPVWAEVENIGDAQLGMSNAEADMSRRAGAGWKEVLPALREAEFSFDLKVDTADVDYTALRDHFMNRTTAEFAVMFGTITTAGEQGLRATMCVIGWNIKQELTGGLIVEVTIKPAPSDNAPVWYTVV